MPGLRQDVARTGAGSSLEVDMSNQPAAASPPILAYLFLIVVVFVVSIYVNLSFAVTDKSNYQYFPPFKANVNANLNDHLGGEYFNMARALAAGEGFSHPFDRKTGPTAWQPPILPLFLAALLWLSDGDVDIVTMIVVFLQVFVLIGTGVLILTLIQQTTERIWIAAAAAVFVIGLLFNFFLSFQYTHDGWLVLLTVDLLIVGVCWCRPLDGWKMAVGWGTFGGVCAMINPGVALTWGVLSVCIGIRHRAWRQLAIAGLLAAITMTPWAVRNYFVFGRFIPSKSNLFYEMYQAQGLQTPANHPYHTKGKEKRDYDRLGETAFLDLKRDQLMHAIAADPMVFVERVASRFLTATLWYMPFPSGGLVSQSWAVWMRRAIHPLPFLAFLFLVGSALCRRLDGAQWIVIGIYCVYLLPYIGASYYERYGFPLMGVKVLLVIWAVDRVLAFARWMFSRWKGKTLAEESSN